MRRRLVPIAVAALAIAAAAGSPTEAADLLPNDQILFEEAPVANQRGFYFRVDALASFSARPDGAGFRDESIDPGVGFDVGVGYQLNDWFRGDVTVGYHGRRAYDATGPCIGCAGGGPARFSTDVGAVPILANAYVGLPNSTIFTPYLGGGIGGAYVFTAGGQQDIVGGGARALPDGGQWNFAWHLSAGVSADILPNASIDLGYRYADYGEVRTGRIAGREAKLGSLRSHQVRLGVRMQLR